MSLSIAVSSDVLIHKNHIKIIIQTKLGVIIYVYDGSTYV